MLVLMKDSIDNIIFKFSNLFVQLRCPRGNGHNFNVIDISCYYSVDTEVDSLLYVTHI